MGMALLWDTSAYVLKPKHQQTALHAAESFGLPAVLDWVLQISCLCKRMLHTMMFGLMGVAQSVCFVSRYQVGPMSSQGILPQADASRESMHKH